MKHINEYYEEWCGKHHTTNDCYPVHDSSETIEFAEYYHTEMMRCLTKDLKNLPNEPKTVSNDEQSKKVCDCQNYNCGSWDKGICEIINYKCYFRQTD